MVSDQAGKSNLLAELKRLGIEVEKDDPRLDTLLDEVKEREAQGYAYEGADASFELLARAHARHGAGISSTSSSFRVIVERRYNANGELITVSEAMVKVRVDGETHDVGRRGQRPGQRARHRAAQGSRHATRPRSPTSNWSTTRCVSSTAAPRRSPAC